MTTMWEHRPSREEIERMINELPEGIKVQVERIVHEPNFSASSFMTGLRVSQYFSTSEIDAIFERAFKGRLASNNKQEES